MIKHTLYTSLYLGAAFIAFALFPASASAQNAQETHMAAMTETQSPRDSVTARWDALLGHYVKAPDANGVALFDYARLAGNAEDRAALTDYIDRLAGLTPSEMNDDEAVAYWANLYNALTVNIVVENYPVDSIREIGGGVFSKGPWKKDIITVEDESLSLDNIEHDIMRAQFPSPLIHYMVNCASMGCPNLKDGLWRAETLDADRDAAARAFINSPRGVRVQEDELEVSSIYKWYKEDFGGNKKGILAHIANYAEGDLAAAIEAGAKIDGYDYDWSLNEVAQ